MSTEWLHDVPSATSVPSYSSTELIMGLPITIVITDTGKEKLSIASRPSAEREAEMAEAAQAAFAHFRDIDEQFSPYKETSEVRAINRGELSPASYSREMQHVLHLCEETKRRTHGYFDAWSDGKLDPSGLVKGLSVYEAAEKIRLRGFENFCIDAGGDIEIRGRNAGAHKWRIGIRNPFNTDTVIKTLVLENRGIATSGLYIRGNHIYDPHTGKPANEIASFTVVGPNVYEADRLATAAFAMGARGLELIAEFPGFDAYMVEYNGIATYTDGFLRYVTL